MGIVLSIGIFLWVAVIAGGLYALRAQLQRAQSPLASVLAAAGIANLLFSFMGYTVGALGLDQPQAAPATHGAGSFDVQAIASQMGGVLTAPNVVRIAALVGLIALSACVVVLWVIRVRASGKMARR